MGVIDRLFDPQTGVTLPALDRLLDPRKGAELEAQLEQEVDAYLEEVARRQFCRGPWRSWG